MAPKLNQPQLRAVQHLDGPLLVLAGAGSGKTRVITQKIAWLIRECGYKASSVAAITFTNKAAREMADRVSGLVKAADAKGLTVTTFHSLGLKLLRIEHRAAGLKSGFSILDSADSLRIIAEQVGNDNARAKQVAHTLSLWKNAAVAPETAIENAQTAEDFQAARAYLAYQQALAAYQAVDFDDLILRPYELLASDPEIAQRWQEKLRYLLVDEYQDTNTAQYRLLKLLAGLDARFTAVGDDDQAIYGWRGANSDNIDTLAADYPRLEIIKLEQNYRSTVRILRAANAVIANNPKPYPKKLWSELGLGDKIQVIACQGEEQEAENIVTRLLARKWQGNLGYADFAILYRGNHQARVFEQALRNQKVPYLLSGGSSFFERTEIKDVMSYLRLIANADDDPAFIRAITTPKRGIGAQTLEALGQYAAERHVSLFAALFEAGIASRLGDKALNGLREFGDFINRLEYRARNERAADIIEELLAAIGYQVWLFDQDEPRKAEKRWQNVRDFVDWLAKKGDEDSKNLFELTQAVALINILDRREDEEVDAVRLSTLHAAKGLEFPHVYLAGVEEGLLPHRESVDAGTIDEERRLFYVGLTRARYSLTLSYCAKRRRGGSWALQEPSRFIKELPLEDVVLPGSDKPLDAQSSKARLAAIKDRLAGKNRGPAAKAAGDTPWNDDTTE